MGASLVKLTGNFSHVEPGTHQPAEVPFSLARSPHLNNRDEHGVDLAVIPMDVILGCANVLSGLAQAGGPSCTCPATCPTLRPAAFPGGRPAPRITLRLRARFHGLQQAAVRYRLCDPRRHLRDVIVRVAHGHGTNSPLRSCYCSPTVAGSPARGARSSSSSPANRSLRPSCSRAACRTSHRLSGAHFGSFSSSNGYNSIASSTSTHPKQASIESPLHTEDSTDKFNEGRGPRSAIR